MHEAVAAPALIRGKALHTSAIGIALAVSLVCVIYGFIHTHVDFRYLWTPRGLGNLEWFSALYWDVFLILFVMRKTLVRPVTLAAAAGVVLSIAGPGVGISIAIVFLGSWAIGALLLKKDNTLLSFAGETNLLRLTAGFVVLETFMYATARVGMHYPAVILALLLLPVVFVFRQLPRILSGLFHCARSGSANNWELFTESVLCFVLFCSSLLALSPEVGGDVLSMHLAVGTDIAAHHRFTYLPAVVSWSAMPLGADFCFAIAYNLGGEIGARLENFGFFVLLLATLFIVGRRFTPRKPDLFLVLAMFASCSLVQFDVDSAMVGNLWALLCAGMFLALLNYYETARARYLFLCSMLGGGAMMVKLGSLAFLLALLPFVVYAIWRNRGRGAFRKSRVIPTAAILLLALSAIPYALAYARTGNPVFPFANAFWKSPLLDTATNVIDYRWRSPIRSTILFDLTFHTSKYLESRPGGFGYTLLLFALPCLAALSRRWKFGVLACFLVPLLFAGLTFSQVRYIRYLYPGLAIISLLPACLFLRAHRLHRGLYAVLAVLAVAGTGLNYYFAPAFGGFEGDFYNFSPADRLRYMQASYRPIQAIDFLNREAPDAPVLFVDSNHIAGLTGHPYALTWHFYPVFTGIKQARNFEEIRKVLDAYSIRYILHSLVPQLQWRVRSMKEIRQQPWTATYVPVLFNEFLHACTTPVFNRAGWEVRKVGSCHS